QRETLSLSSLSWLLWDVGCGSATRRREAPARSGGVRIALAGMEPVGRAERQFSVAVWSETPVGGLVAASWIAFFLAVWPVRAVPWDNVRRGSVQRRPSAGCVHRGRAWCRLPRKGNHRHGSSNLPRRR